MMYTNIICWTLALIYAMRHADALGMSLCLFGFLFMHFMIEDCFGTEQ